METKHLHIYVSGRVQRVFYRESSRKKAEELGILGWIKNLEDGRVEAKIFGMDCIFQFGGGIHGHPNGTQGGAKAVREALYASLNKIPISEYAKDHRDLQLAIEKWGK